MEIRDKIFNYVDTVLYEIELIEKYNIRVSEIKIQEIINTLKETIKIIGKQINDQSNYLKTNAEWNKYSICFFGETNAGKSTIIETLISLFKNEKRTGATIGTGRKDFTTVFESYKIKLNGYDFIITDMPGIEGNETKYENEIKHAIAKSHTIFYVNGTNKKPETGTIEKIGNYLNYQGDVFSILNIHGKADWYEFEEDRKTIYTPNIEKAIKAQNSIFQNILGNSFKKTLYFNALMSFCSTCNPERNDLIRAQKNYKKVFKKLEIAYDFSNFETLKSTIIELSKNANYKIAASNTQKVTKIFDSLICKLDDIYYNGFKTYLLSDVKQITKQSIENVNTIFKKYDAFIKHHINNEITNLKNILRKEIHNAIDEERNKSYIKEKIERESSKFNLIIKDVLNSLILDLKEEIENELNELKNRLNLSVSLNSFNMEINIDEILEKLNHSIGEIFKTIGVLGLEIVGVILTFLANPILGIISGVISLIKNIWKFFFSDNRDSMRKKREAKDKANDSLNIVTQRLQSKIQKDLVSELANNKANIDKELNKIYLMFDAIENFTIVLSNSIIIIKDAYKELTTIHKIYSNDK